MTDTLLETFVLTYEAPIRLSFFFGVFALMALWEVWSPQRNLIAPKGLRWSGNLGLVVLNSLLVRLLFPFAAVGVASFCAAHGWGLLNHFAVPFWLAAPLSVIVLDFVIWMQHATFHAVPVLWRLHQVHHADVDFDVTTGSRFHPIEIVLSMGVKFAAIALLGVPVVAVVVFEVLLSSAAMFNHSNIRLTPAVDRVVRWFIVTPDFHRVHHSVDAEETRSNFGFNLPWWDRLLGTYRDEPRGGQQGMTIGLPGQTDLNRVARLDGLLLLPFKQPLSKQSN